MKPAMLATDISKAGFNTKPEFYLNSDEWGLQQKMDGVRMMVEYKSGKVACCYNRNGEEIATPESIKDYRGLSWGVVDGEYLNGEFYPFDIVEGAQAFIDRHDWLTRMMPQTIPLFIDHWSKTKAFNNLAANGAEGVIFRKLSGMYQHKRSSLVVKYKFTSDVDCVVLERPDPKDTNANFYLGMWDGKQFVEVGKVSALTGDGPKIKIGDVVKVTCLYVSKTGRLYQPVTPKIRVDKKPNDCTIDQLDSLRPNKEVIV